MKGNEELANLAERVYHRMIDKTVNDWGMNIESWDWVPGVGVISILAYGQLTGNEEAFAYLRRWTQRNKHLSEHVNVINSMAPYAIFPELYRLSGEPWYLETAIKIGDWMLADAPRTREGAYEHTVTENAKFSEQVWADTLFMAVLFLARLAKLTGESKYAKEAEFQLLVHLRLLQDPQTGVLFHGWNGAEGNHMSSARWIRANAWVILASPWIAEEIGSLTPVTEEIVDRYRQLAAGLRHYQGESGLWSTVMDQPEFYAETSGSAGIAAGWLAGMRMGWLDVTYKEAVNRTVQGVIERIEPDGTVQSVSGGTPVMPSIPAYQKIPCFPTLYGQGLTLILLSLVHAEMGGSYGKCSANISRRET
ncbi:unsaturated rhamnogalacturonyl hydrolase [Paenibacillus uliginis N3/975]|uniref:Unsaturated rhamnogalacturonyl hydrolase n=1 Tax=Paenibacillus uliginis N3/975 TaxID=1313296 RepID=A0A1X7HD56_9BACL|nr:glycoside hydrolase family 88 protein [Paenibacillus uliginis]SMF84348.1 unsaturated rhamnogalacturonyl hydrolase [Paenibacillus uliginis N3/975]